MRPDAKSGAVLQVNLLGPRLEGARLTPLITIQAFCASSVKPPSMSTVMMATALGLAISRTRGAHSVLFGVVVDRARLQVDAPDAAPKHVGDVQIVGSVQCQAEDFLDPGRNRGPAVAGRSRRAGPDEDDVRQTGDGRDGAVGRHPADGSKGLSDVHRAGWIHGERTRQLDKGTDRRAAVARVQSAGYGLSGVSRRLLSGNRQGPGQP